MASSADLEKQPRGSWTVLDHPFGSATRTRLQRLITSAGQCKWISYTIQKPFIVGPGFANGEGEKWVAKNAKVEEHSSSLVKPKCHQTMICNLI